MKTLYKLTWVLTVLFVWTGFSQEKWVGNREVTTELRAISDFTKIEVIDDIDVQLIYNEDQGIEVETDSNLHGAILTEISNGTLTIKTSGKIQRKKELKLYIKVGKGITEISAYNKSKIESKNLLLIDSFSLNSFDDSEFDLKLNSKQVTINSKKSSTVKIEVLTENIDIIAEESSTIKGTIDCKNSTVKVLDKSSISIEGIANTLDIETYGNSSFKGKDFKVKEAVVKLNNNSNAYINTTDNLKVFARNSSELYIYSSPKISLPEFFDKATLYKREADRKLF